MRTEVYVQNVVEIKEREMIICSGEGKYPLRGKLKNHRMYVCGGKSCSHLVSSPSLGKMAEQIVCNNRHNTGSDKREFCEAKSPNHMIGWKINTAFGRGMG